jgi:enterochelin esterase-like enzyme
MLKQTVIVCLLLLALTGCAQPPAAQPPPPPPTAQPTSPPTVTPTLVPESGLSQQKIISQALAGNLLGDPAERRYFIYLPPSYPDGNKRYPVVYILHEFWGNEYSMLRMQGPYEVMLREGTVQEMILVFPNGSNKLGGSIYRSSPTIGDYETYLARELVDHVDANYRTIPHPDSRGITGCSMGGEGAIHLALTFPDVYSVAAPMSASYDFSPDPTTLSSAANLQHVPQDFDEYRRISGSISIAVYIALAAGIAPNPDKPPFYLDMPFEVVDGKGRVVPEVMEKIVAAGEVHELEEYLGQPLRLRHILLYHGASDQMAPVELARSFDQLLTERGVEHDFMEVDGGHCDYDMTPVLQYMSDHLAGEQP